MPNQPATPNRNIRFPEELREALLRIADERGESFSDVVRRACEKYVREWPARE